MTRANFLVQCSKCDKDFIWGLDLQNPTQEAICPNCGYRGMVKV